MYKKIIVREPCSEMMGGLTSAGLGVPDYPLAREQHKTYIEALVKCGCEVITLPADPDFPDSVFVEDPALLIGSAAILANPGAASRRGEVSGMRQVLGEHFGVLEQICSPGTLDAGDVLEVEDHYYIGLSERTNMEGAGQLIRILEKYNKSGSTIPVNKYLHLKSGVAYLGNNTLLLAGELKKCEDFQEFIRLEVDDDEEYAANSIMVNGTVVTPAGFPKTIEMLLSSGFRVLTVDTSEYRKLDGGVSCLSLRF
ncbi:dimethylarginine dimethylaminohydrolase family protein [Bacteroidota bacterium]